MRDVLIPLLVASLVIIGCVLLRDGLSQVEPSQTTKIVGGASCLSAGFIGSFLSLRNWVEMEEGLEGNTLG